MAEPPRHDGGRLAHLRASIMSAPGSDFDGATVPLGMEERRAAADYLCTA